MKKGFTLVELLIVMVIVALLVTIAVPKYKTAMERARGQQGLANAAAISDALNAYYILHGNSYEKSETDVSAAQFSVGKGSDSIALSGVAATVGHHQDNTTEDWFSYKITHYTGGRQMDVELVRNLPSDKKYTIVFMNQDGEVTDRYCSGNERYCKAIGATVARSGGGWFF